MNQNFCHKSISNLHYKYKHIAHTGKHSRKHSINSQMVIVQSSSSSDKAVCSAKHEDMQEDRHIDRLRIQLSSSPLLQYYRRVFFNYHSITV